MQRTQAIFDFTFHLAEAHVLELAARHQRQQQQRKNAETDGTGNGDGDGVTASPSTTSAASRGLGLEGPASTSASTSSPPSGPAGSELTWHFPHRFYQLEYHTVSDEGIFTPEVLAARRRREEASLRIFLEHTRRLGTLADFHAFLSTEHLCYAVARQDEFGREEGRADDLSLQSY
jgi:hypothetical protein